eukprot:gene12047-12190_t
MEDSVAREFDTDYDEHTLQTAAGETRSHKKGLKQKRVQEVAADAPADTLLLLAQGKAAASKRQPTASQPGRRNNKAKAKAAGPEAEVLAVSSNDN